MTSIVYVPKIRVALFDMAATSVDDNIQKPGVDGTLPLVLAAYLGAFKKANITIPFDELNGCRGKDKIEVFRRKVAKYRTDLDEDEQLATAQRLHDREFVPALLANVPYVREMPGTSDTFAYLKARGVFVATGSGFPQVVTDAINEKLGWKKKGLVDYGTCGAAAGGGRPKPNMINDVLIAAGILPGDINRSVKQDEARIGEDGYASVLKVGDTVEDIHEGQKAGATTVAVASGTQKLEVLLRENPIVVLPSIAAVPNYLQNHGYIR